jgi:predicted nucleic acid-binding Zn ribbon protein
VEDDVKDNDNRGIDARSMRPQEYEQAMALFDARPQMGRECFDGLTLPERVARLFEIRDAVGALCVRLAGAEQVESKVVAEYPNKADALATEPAGKSHPSTHLLTRSTREPQEPRIGFTELREALKKLPSYVAAERDERFSDLSACGLAFKREDVSKLLDDMEAWEPQEPMTLHGRPLPPEQLEAECHCGYQPEGDPVFHTGCPHIEHRARSGKQWRTIYIEQFRASCSDCWGRLHDYFTPGVRPGPTKILFCKNCGASIPPREGEGTCKEGCVPHYPQKRKRNDC